MIKYILSLLIPFTNLLSQQDFNGRIVYKEGTETIPLMGANIYWLKTSSGVVTNQEGAFSIARQIDKNKLVISYVGFISDTLIIKKEKKYLVHFLKPNTEDSLEEVIISKRKTIQRSIYKTQNVINVNSAELLKAACCNLSESFETNPSIDVNFSDALTGTKQIQMLGLKSPYLLITEENIPSIRGASQAYGLTFTPGTWIESIQISKGAGSVVNGFESISGQINTELKKPFSDAPFFLNFFSSANGRVELNNHLNKKVSQKWDTGIYIHANKRRKIMDLNNDNFLDVPLSKQINLLNRWQYTDTEKGFVSFISFRWMKDDKQVGSKNYKPNNSNKFSFWGSEIKTNRFDTSIKIGYVFPKKPYQSIGFQTAYNNHDQDGYYGYRIYKINHKSFYTNILFNSIIQNTKNKFKSGINITNDKYIEEVDKFYFNRIDFSFGGFFEYSYDNLENLSLIGGIRFDNHNRLGFFITPRFHIKYSISDKTVIRGSIGTGRKAANIFAENQSLFGTNRLIKINQEGGDIYGLNPEKALNYGVSIRQNFYIKGRSLNFIADYYVTSFINQVVVDWEQKGEISFYNIEGSSQAKSFQLELDYSPTNSLSIRFAYKNYDVKTDYRSGLLQNPLQAKVRFFSNLSWESKINKNGGQWRFDITQHFVGNQRLVIQSEFQSNNLSPSYSLVNSQITRSINDKLEIYLGGENLGGYTQKKPIIGSENPFESDFDSSQIFAPVFGRMIYLGLRWSL
jgi:outer membrane receptor for ferrienterochelin and colicins